MAHLFFCCEMKCEETAHVYGGRCDYCFEAYIVTLREKHNPASHKCSGRVDYDFGCYVCDDNDDPRCPSHHLARALHKECATREEILNEIEYLENLFTLDRDDEDHAATRLSIKRLRRKLAQMCEDCGNQLSYCRDSGQILCPPCASRLQYSCDECGEPSNNGRATCLCWADEEDLARMDRDAALHR